MNLVDRVKNILTMPLKEWQVIDSEPADPGKITTSYLLPLALLGAVAAFIGYGLIGINLGFGIKFKGIDLGLKMAIAYIIRTIVSVFILAFIIDILAPNFGSDKNFGKSFQVAAYSATAGLVAGLFLIIPALAILALLGGLYGLYLLYVGLPIIKKSPADKSTTYFLVVLLVAIIVGVLLNYLQNQIFLPTQSLYSY
jgi:hypothetical protein